MNGQNGELRQDEIIQIVPSHRWGGCLAVVSEIKSWGCQAYVAMPSNDGAAPGQAFIRLKWEEFERVCAFVIFAPMDGQNGGEVNGENGENGERGSKR